MPEKFKSKSGFRRFFAVAVVGVCLLAGADIALAKKGDASAFIRDFGVQAVSVLQSHGNNLEAREQAFRKLLAEKFDLTLIGRFSLGRYWRRASAAQRRDYLNLFNEYVLQTYASKLGGYAGEKLIVVSETALSNKKDFYVKSRIQRPSGPPIKATWRVRMGKDGTRIIDILVEGISMAVTQRDQFAAVVRRNGFEGLLQVLRARTDKMPVTTAAK
jgi:phospholipid transport system substrate-binding protein